MGRENGFYVNHGEGFKSYHDKGGINNDIVGVGGVDLSKEKILADLNHQPQIDSDVIDHSQDVICVDENKIQQAKRDWYDCSPRQDSNSKPFGDIPHRDKRAQVADRKSIPNHLTDEPITTAERELIEARKANSNRPILVNKFDN